VQIRVVPDCPPTIPGRRGRRAEAKQAKTTLSTLPLSQVHIRELLRLHRHSCGYSSNTVYKIMVLGSIWLVCGIND